MPLSAKQQEKTDALAKHFTDAMEREYKRKCDEIYESAQKFKSRDTFTTEQAKIMIGRFSQTVRVLKPKGM